MSKKISVIIPSWNGKRLLEKNLPKVRNNLPRNVEIIVVDDGSVDDSLSYLNKVKNRYSIKVLRNTKNKGFISGCHKGIKHSSREFFILLNNDVIPHKGILNQLIKYFNDKKVFAINFNEKQYDGWAKIWWRGGFIHHGVEKSDGNPHFSAWASGGSGMFRRSIWEKLDGFDEMYAPFYWEDFDLGFRAWASGWKILWEPKALVDHKHESTTSKIDRNYVNVVKERNQLLFIWKNIENKYWRFENFFGMALRVVLGPNYIKVILAAKKRYKEFGYPRLEKRTLSDKEIIDKFK